MLCANLGDFVEYIECIVGQCGPSDVVKILTLKLSRSVCLHNGTSALFELLVPRTDEMKVQMLICQAIDASNSSIFIFAALLV